MHSIRLHCASPTSAPCLCTTTTTCLRRRRDDQDRWDQLQRAGEFNGGFRRRFVAVTVQSAYERNLDVAARAPSASSSGFIYTRSRCAVDVDEESPGKSRTTRMSLREPFLRMRTVSLRLKTSPFLFRSRRVRTRLTACYGWHYWSVVIHPRIVSFGTHRRRHRLWLLSSRTPQKTHATSTLSTYTSTPAFCDFAFLLHLSIRATSESESKHNLA